MPLILFTSDGCTHILLDVFMDNEDIVDSIRFFLRDSIETYMYIVRLKGARLCYNIFVLCCICSLYMHVCIQ